MSSLAAGDDRAEDAAHQSGATRLRYATLMGIKKAKSKEVKKLSRAALETLAIVAYHQPATRAEIEDIRGRYS